MRPAETLRHNFRDKYFSQVVWELVPSSQFMIPIKARPGDELRTLKGVVGCSAQQLQELSTFCKLPHLPVDHPKRGLRLDSWTQVPSVN